MPTDLANGDSPLSLLSFWPRVRECAVPPSMIETAPPCRTVVGLFPRHHENHAFDESDPEYVPDSPPQWARVVDIG
ncbi:hypothetical protein AB0D40_29865 [Streptomyces massasporeus]|uniref:hypothetical protein n=1 Tax=Streptomyces massasporeus TaxID=67324 RepID=UPI0033C9B3E0